ncbi:stalk domain-containing protein [Desulfofalx alkaliphila]|uniref:stalk domain-containing protein n=1 Tax=Desulfofalx alkaliphila TaxID=105483 RepID=UPI00068EABAB|nr:stalk domain-containing protein [Desulfofalx alkaliphila]
MKFKKGICTILALVFMLVFVAGAAHAEEFEHKIEYIKKGERDVTDYAQFGPEIKSMLPDLYVQMGSHMSFFLGEMEIVSINGVPWQLTEYAEKMREGFKNEPESILKQRPELENLIFDVRTNGKYGTIYKLAKQGKSEEYIRSVVLGESANAQPKKPTTPEPQEPAEPTEPTQTDNNKDALEPDAILTLYVNSNQYSVRKGDFYKGGTLDATPFIHNQTTMVPLRGVIDKFGADLAWDASNRTVTITKGEDTIVLLIGVNKAQVNGKAQSLNTPPIINRDRTFIPLRFVSEGLGFDVTWNASEKSVTIKQ